MLIMPHGIDQGKYNRVNIERTSSLYKEYRVSIGFVSMYLSDIDYYPKPNIGPALLSKTETISIIR